MKYLAILFIVGYVVVIGHVTAYVAFLFVWLAVNAFLIDKYIIKRGI